ncbi:MAG TPA: hypothetical protein PKA90_07780 [Ignavibacteria bacterium]|nr:hypothetical protein [Ignavibacteria bacterium]HMR40317.1 hypothetical protein [Ignavibacteria bacterium]
MNLFKKLFAGRNGNTAETTVLMRDDLKEIKETNNIDDMNNIKEFGESIEIDENLFEDKGTPEKKAIASEKKTGLSEFIEKDYYSDGYNDGYDYPSENILNSSVEKIKSDFILILEKTIDEMNNEIIKLSEHTINISEISPRACSLTDNRIKELRKLILRMIEEKELCENNKGMILSPINSYVSGFDKGLFTFTQEKMIMSSTGLF